VARRIATVSGIALRPGVSRNGRLYTKDMIARAVADAQTRIGSGDAKFRNLDDDMEESNDFMSQRTHHAAEDDSTRIVGRLTSLTMNKDGEAEFTADIADTPHAKIIDSLIRPKQDPNDPDDVDPFLKGVSIRGAWSGKVQTVMHNGIPVEKGEDLHIYGLDYTGTPGVPGAEITGYRRAGNQAREADDRVLIYESIMEGHVETAETTENAADHRVSGCDGECCTDCGVNAANESVAEKGAPALKSGKPAAAPTKAPSGSYADPGYQDDKAKRYPIDTKAHAKAAWGYINQAKQAKNYTAAQLKRIKGRIKAALKKFGVDVTDESWLIDRWKVSETVTENMAYAMLDGNQASFHVSLDNGMVCVTVASCCVDPHDLDALGHAAMEAAVAALEKIDPDMDGDMDVPGAPAEDPDMDTETKPDDDAMESTVDPEVKETEAAPEPVADDNKEEAAVSEPTAPASEKPAAATETTENSGMDALSAKFDKLTDAIAGLVSKMAAPAPVAATESVVEAPAAPVVTETEDQRVARLVAEQVAAQKTAMIQELVESGYAPSRKGLVAPAVQEAALGTGAGDEYPANWPTENGQPVAPHKLTEEQFRNVTRPMLEQAVLGQRSIFRQQ
jgi:hypothetical protein